MQKNINISVVAAAERRIVEAFNDNRELILSFSGGKDSICMSDMVVRTMQKYGISFQRLLVIFFDEEAIYPDVEQIAMEWRDRFIALGAKFIWFCLPVRHYNCCNMLSNDESFYCWEPGTSDRWVRKMPPFATTSFSGFKFGMNYQEFTAKCIKLKQFVGLRIDESIQRRNAIGSASRENSKYYYPIYDWKNNDVWLYIRMRGLNYPVSYIYLYKTGVSVNKLRISQFFSIDTIKTLPKMMEFYPDLYERIIRREPNAELASIYHDTSMFRSSRQDQSFDLDKDYRAMFKKEIQNRTYAGYDLAKRLYMITPKDAPMTIWRSLYNILIAGDPKHRMYRVVYGKIKRLGIK